MEIQFQTTGNLTDDPELRFIPSGQAVANLTVAVTPRKRQGTEWVDGETTFLRGAAWGSLAENVANSLTRGDRVSVTGILRSRTFDTRDGEQRTVLEAVFETVAPDLRFASVKVTKAQRHTATPGAAPGVDEYQAAVQAARETLGGQPVSEESPF